MSKREHQIMELLKSGDFTIAYHDRGDCSLYKGKYDYKSLPKKSVAEFCGDHNGYCPEIVEILSKALGGATDSI